MAQLSTGATVGIVAGAVVLVGGGAAVIYFATRKPAPAPAAPKPPAGAVRGIPGGKRVGIVGIIGYQPASAAGALRGAAAAAAAGSGGKGAQSIGAQISDAEQAAWKKLKDEYNKLTGEARKKGASATNKAIKDLVGVDPGLTGSENFDQAATKIGAAAGSALGGAAGTAVLGPLGGPLGAMVGGYLGKEIGPYLDDAWDSVKGAVSSAASDVVDFFGSLF